MVSLDGELHPIIRSDDGGHEVVRVGRVRRVSRLVFAICGARSSAR